MVCSNWCNNETNSLYLDQSYRCVQQERLMYEVVVVTEFWYKGKFVMNEILPAVGTGVPQELGTK